MLRSFLSFSQVTLSSSKQAASLNSPFKYTFNFVPNVIQTANFRTNLRRGTYWVNRRGGGYDEHLTAENQNYLSQLLAEKYAVEASPLKDAPWKRGQFNPAGINKRIGVLAIKLGSVPQWTKNGKKFYATLLQVLDNHVIDYVPPEVLMQKSESLRSRTKEGQLGMAIVGALSSDPRLYTPEYLNLFRNSGVPPKRKLTKFMLSENAAVKPGTPLYAAHFRVGDYVDVGAKTIGFGFQGAMKKWGMKGGPRSHGATKFHRKRGNIGSGRDRKPIKGTKMPGPMGKKWRRLMGLKIWRINNKYNILYVQGPSIPGPTHCYVRVTDSCLPKNAENMTPQSHPPFPTFFVDEQSTAKLPEEDFHKDLHKFSETTIKFEDVEVKKAPKREGAKLAKIKN